MFTHISTLLSKFYVSFRIVVMSDDDDYGSLTDDEYEDVIADYLSPNNFEICIVFVFLSLMAIGVSGNSLVVYVVIKRKKLVSCAKKSIIFESTSI